MALAVTQTRDLLHLVLALQPQHAEHQRTRGIDTQQKSRGRLAAKRIVDDARDGGTIAGAGKATRQPPGFERLGGGPALRFNVGEHFNGGGKASGRRHIPTTMSNM